MEKLKLGLAGIGRIGKLHLENLVHRMPEVEVVAAVDPAEEGRAFAQQLGIPHVDSQFSALLEHPDIDAVIICTPSDTHAEYVMAASNAGKAIFCEKPLDLSLDTVRKVLAVLQQNNTPMMLAFNRRFDPNFMRVRQSIIQGEVGDPYVLRITSRDCGPPPLSYVKQSGGLFLDMAIHDFDMARYIIGSEVKEVYAKAAVRISPGIAQYGDVDVAIISLTFENGCLGTIDNSREAVYGYDQRLEVLGSKGMIKVDNRKADDHKLYRQQSISEAMPLYHFLDRYVESYYLEMKAFVDALLHQKPMPVGGDDGLKSIAIGLAAALSVTENRPVTLTEITG